jgi:hypothetical protein
MAQKVIVTLEDDLDGGPADETVRFRVDGAAYEIDLSKKTPRRSAASSLRSSIMPAGPGGDSAAGQGGPQPAGTAAGASGHGRRTRALRLAPAGVSPPA